MTLILGIGLGGAAVVVVAFLIIAAYWRREGNSDQTEIDQKTGEKNDQNTAQKTDQYHGNGGK